MNKNSSTSPIKNLQSQFQSQEFGSTLKNSRSLFQHNDGFASTISNHLEAIPATFTPYYNQQNSKKSKLDLLKPQSNPQTISSKKGKFSKKNSAMPTKPYLNFENKENIDSNSKKAKKIGVQSIILDQDIIQKLRMEVQKQVLKKEEDKAKLESNKAQRHMNSVIPFEVKQRLRKQSLQKEAEQQQIMAKEQEEKRKNRLKIKIKREQQRLENFIILGEIKKSINSSSQKKQDAVDNFNQKLDFQYEDLDDLDAIMSHPLRIQQPPALQINHHQVTLAEDNFLTEARYNLQENNDDKFLKQRQSPSQVKKIKYQGQHLEYQPFAIKQQKKINQNNLHEKEDRHQGIENYLKEQKFRRLKLKKEQDEQESKKLLKLKSQLTNLHIDYFKGVQEFKEKQRVSQNDKISQKRSISKKKKTSKKPSSSKKKAIDFQDLIENQKSGKEKQRGLSKDYISFQRNSMPQLMVSPKINLDPRGSFQSPYMLQQMKTYDNINGGLTSLDSNSTQHYSPDLKKIIVNKNKKFQTKTFRTTSRDSQVSQYSIGKSSKDKNNFADTLLQPSLGLSLRHKTGSQPHLFNQSQPLNLQEVDNSFNPTRQYETLRVQKPTQQKIVDLNSDKMLKMLAEFSQARQDLATQFKNEKKQKAVFAYQSQKPVKKLKKKIKTTSGLAKKDHQNMPFLKQQHLKNKKLISQNQIGQLQQLHKTVESGVILDDQEQRIQVARNKVIEKIQEMQILKNQIQNHQEIKTPTILEEESKDVQESSYFIDSIVKQNLSPQVKILNIDSDTELSQVVLKFNSNKNMQSSIKDNDISHFIASEQVHQEFLNLKQQDSNQSDTQLEEAALVLQKHFRGYICRKIMREKLRIDREFRILRQKYEVRSQTASVNSNFQSRLLSSVKDNKVTFNAFQENLSPNNLNPFKSNYKHELDKKSDQSKLSEQKDQQSQKDASFQEDYNDFKVQSSLNNQDESQKFYNKDNLGNLKENIVSAFVSPTIEENSLEDILEDKQEEYQPLKLEFQESLLKEQDQSKKLRVSNLVENPLIIKELHDSQDFEKLDILEESKEDNESFINDANLSQRSQMPIDEEIPNITNKLNYILDSSSNIQDKSQEKHQEFLDSPLQINDLQGKINQKNHKQLIPRQILETQKQQIQVFKKGEETKIQEHIQGFNMSDFTEDDQSQQNFQKTFQQYNQPNNLSQHFGSYLSDRSNVKVLEDNDSYVQSRIKPPKSQASKKNDSLNNTSVFEKNSFQLFASDNVKSVFKAESEIEQMIADLNKALKKKIKKKEHDLKEEQLSVRTYNRKKVELEKWVEKEKREIKMTRRYFMQGCMRLSSLLDHLVKEQGRMKSAVNSIRQPSIKTSNRSLQNLSNTSAVIRKSHSFEAEIKQQEEDLQAHPYRLDDIRANISEGFNTVSGRRLSSNGGSSLDVIDQKQLQTVQTNGDDIKPLYQEQKLFEYQPKKQQTVIEDEDDEEEEKIIEIKALEDQFHSQSKQQHFQNNNLILDDQDTLSKNQSSQFSLLDSGPSNNLQLSDTPLNKEEQLNFPDVLESMENMEKEQDFRVNILVEEILQGILLREMKERLFPARPLSKLIKQKKIAQDMEILHQQVLQKEEELKLPQFEDQIKVLDNILDELSPESLQKVEDASSKSRNSPDAVNDNFGPSLQEVFPKKQLEFNDEEKSPVNNSPSKRGIESGIEQVNTYMHEIFDKLKTDKSQLTSVLENVSQPLYKDPLMILAHLQNSFPEPPAQGTNAENGGNDDSVNQVNPYESAMPFQQSVLSVDLYLDIEKERRGGLSLSQLKDSFHGDTSNSFLQEMENIHNKAIFDAVNEALDGFRPYGLRGPPLPWSKNNKTLTFKFGKEETVDYLMSKVKYRVLDWSHMSAGTLPRKSIMNQREKEQLELIREERLARILIQEAEENEQLWVDYEYEETQTKLDLAEMIMEKLCLETAQILDGIQQNKELNKDQQM